MLYCIKDGYYIGNKGGAKRLEYSIIHIRRMGDQYVEVVNLLTKTERELYFTLREELGALVDVEMKLIQASQKIVLD